MDRKAKKLSKLSKKFYTLLDRNGIEYRMYQGVPVGNLNDIMAYISEMGVPKSYVDGLVQDEANIREQADNQFEQALRDESEERAEEITYLLGLVAGCYNTAAQSNNKLTLTKQGGEVFEYEPTIPPAMAFKGTCLQASLPTTGQIVGDYWKLSDTTGQYVGQCAIWDGTQWTYSNSNIAVDQSVQESSTNPVAGGAVYTQLGNKADKSDTYTKTEITTLLQSFYDGILPVGSVWSGFGAPGVPTGISATWTDVSNEFNNRYFKVSSTQSVGTPQAAELPNIQAFLGYYYGTTELKWGALDSSYAGQYWSKTQKTADWDYNNAIVFNASQGQTNVPGGGFVPQAQSVYKDGGEVRPLTTTIKVWRRTA